MPKPTPEFNQLIGEADYLMSAILLEIQTRINSFNPATGITGAFGYLSITNIQLLKNLSYTHGNYEFIKKFEKTLPGQKFFYGGYDQSKAELILKKYKKIVKMRNSIAHGLPHNINGKYVKIHRSIDKNKIVKDVIVDEAFLIGFIEECISLIDIFKNPDYISLNSCGRLWFANRTLTPGLNLSVFSQSETQFTSPERIANTISRLHKQ